MLNNVTLMGRLTRDPELRNTTTGIAVTSFSLAVERDFKNASGEKETDFIDIVAWRHTAEFVCNYFQKGLLVAVTGAIQTRKYEDKEGNNRKAVEIVANSVYFAESKKKDSNESNSATSGNPLDVVDDSESSGDFDPFANQSDGDDDFPF